MKMKLGLAAAAACFVACASPSMAATVQLDGVVFNGTDYTFTYGGTLAPTEGVKSGSKLVIFDFAGYVAGSIASALGTITPTVEFTTSGLLIDPNITDDPTLVNLVFTYTGPDFQASPELPGSPYAPIDFTGLSARSIYGGINLDGFSTITVKNVSGPALGTDVFSAGQAGVPAAVPEPGTWAMALFGLGAVGYTMRRRRTHVSFA